MYIQIQPKKNSDGDSTTTERIGTLEEFILSWTTKSKFKLFNSKGNLLKEVVIESAKPLNDGKSSYLAITAYDAADHNITYEGMINFY